MVACGAPKALRILWSQRPEFNPKVRAHLPRSRYIENTRTHYVLVDTNHFVRSLMLDKSGHALINHTSVQT